MFLASVHSEAKAGGPLYSEELGDQASGIVVNAEASPDGGYDLLAAVQTASREGSTVHLKSLGGPVLRFPALPYAIPLSRAITSTSACPQKTPCARPRPSTPSTQTSPTHPA